MKIAAAVIAASFVFAPALMAEPPSATPEKQPVKAHHGKKAHHAKHTVKRHHGKDGTGTK